MERNVIIGDSALTKKRSMQGMIAACLLMVSWTGMGWNALGTYSVFVVEDLGCSTAQFMINFTILSWVNAAISMTIYGICIDKFGTRKMILIGGLFCTAGFALFGVSPSIQFMWFAATVFAIGLAFININTLNVMINSWFKKNTARYTGIAQSFGPLGGAFFNSMWGIVMVSIGFRIPFYISAVISLVFTFLVYILYVNKEDADCLARGEAELLEEAKKNTNNDREVTIETGLSFKASARKGRFWLLPVCYILAGICDYGLLGNFALIAASHGYAEQAGFIMGFSWLFQIAAFLVLGPVCDKLGSKYSQLICFIMVIIVSCLFLADIVSLPIIFLSAALLGFADGAVQLPMGASAREALGIKDFAKKMGIVGGGCYIGVGISTVIVARIFDVTGSYKSAFILIICLSIVTALLFFIATRKSYTEEEVAAERAGLK